MIAMTWSGTFFSILKDNDVRPASYAPYKAPARRPCRAKLLGAASYKENAIWVSPSGATLWEKP
jgi:hypothetical protein